MTGTSSSGPIVIAGGSGFLGVSLATHLAAAGRSIVILSRHPPKPKGPWRHVSWDARTLGEWRRELDGAGSGALARLLRLTRLGLGGTIGSGTQGMSWIHETDMNRLFERALIDPAVHGPYIASSPNPVSQQVLMRELRRAVGMPIGLPAFSWMVRVGARWFLRTDPELALYGRYVVSKRLQEEQFGFQFPHLCDALDDLLDRHSRRHQSAEPIENGNAAM